MQTNSANIVALTRRTLVFTLLLSSLVPAFTQATEPIMGTWLLKRQEINGEETKIAPMQLKVSQIRDSLTFGFAVMVDDAFSTSMGYRVLLDGTEAEVKNAKGEKVGTVKMTKAASSQYAITMGRGNQPPTTGKLTVSADGKTMTSETDTKQGERIIHMAQIFARE